MDSREKILDAAMRLFSGEGFGAASISRVAREANVSKALIFWHFDSKEKLFQSALERSLEPYFINVENLDGLDEPAQLLTLIDLYADFVRDNMSSIRFVLSVLLRSEKQPGETMGRLADLFRLYGELLADVLERGKTRGAFRSGIDPKAEAALLRATLNGALVERFLDGTVANDGIFAHVKEMVRERLLASPDPDGD